MTARHADNLFAVANPRDAAQASSILDDQVGSFGWRKRRARRRPWGKVTAEALQDVCDRLDAIVQLA